MEMRGKERWKPLTAATRTRLSGSQIGKCDTGFYVYYLLESEVVHRRRCEVLAWVRSNRKKVNGRGFEF